MRLRRLEELVQAARVRVGAIEAAIHKADPDLSLAPPRRSPPHHFRKSEVVWATHAALREATGPLSIRDIAALALAAKGIAAEKEVINSIAHSVRKVCVSLGRRGITRKVGQGKATRHILQSQE
jgi:hypothetical protein